MEKLAVLDSTPLFHGAPEAARAALAAGRELACPKGQAVFTPERFSAALGVVLEGTLEVTRGAMRMAALGPGELFGAATLFGDRARYPTTLTAGTPARVLLLERPAVEELMAKWPQVAFGYITYLTQRVNFLSDRLDALGAGPAEEKLVCWLREQGGTVEGLAAGKVAATLNMSRATLYRAMDALTQRGVLVRTGKTIQLTHQAN